MVFVRKPPGRSGSTKVQIAQRRAGRDVVLEHIGTARGEAELAVLMAEARRRLRPGQEALDLELDEENGGQSSRLAVITGKHSALLWRVLASVYQRLGFDVIADEAFQELVLARIIEPTSKADSQRVLNEAGVAHACLPTMFRCLTRAQERGHRDQIAAACFTHAASGGDVSLCLYDVTTLLCRRRHKPCTSRPSRRTSCAKSGFRRSGGWTRKSWSGCSSTATGSPWRSGVSRVTRQSATRGRMR